MRRDERGATMVETAIALPIVILLMFGLCEGALLLNGALGVQNAARDAARAVQAEGGAIDADRAGLLAATRRNGFADAGIEHIYIWHAASADSQPPACVQGVVSTDGCNVYAPTDAERPEVDFMNPAWSAPNGWPGPQRVVSRSTGTDFVGVTVKARVATPFNIFASKAVLVERTTVVRIEATEA